MGDSKSRQVYKKILWVCEHFVLPAAVAAVVIMANNYYQEKRKPSLSVQTKTHKVSVIDDGKYSIECPFRILNTGGSPTKNKLVSLYIPKGFFIHRINIDAPFQGFIVKKQGGVGNRFVFYSVSIPQNKVIYGTVEFYSNIKIPEQPIELLKTEF